MSIELVDGLDGVQIRGVQVTQGEFFAQKERTRRRLSGTPCGSCDNAICAHVREGEVQVGCVWAPTTFKSPPAECGNRIAVQ